VSAYTPHLQQASLLSGRQVIMVGIIALHALVISVLMTMRISPDVQPPEVVLIGRIDPPTRELPPPPPPMPKPVLNTEFTTPKFPVIDPVIPDLVPETVLVLPSDPGPVEMVAPQVGTGTSTVPAIPSTALQFRAIRSADDYYPYASRTLQEEGIAIVQVCVAPSGKLEGSPAIRTSSGSARLDAAALKWASEALRFTPATQGGVPVSACKGFRVHFKLH
jgi:protein TonB